MINMIVAPYFPYKVNDLGNGYYSFDIYADPRPVGPGCPSCHEVTLYRTRAFLLGSPDVAEGFVLRNWSALIEECRNECAENENALAVSGNAL